MPFFTVISEGLKLKFSIETAFELFADGVLVLVVVEEVDLFLFRRKKPAMAKMTTTTITINIFLMTFYHIANFSCRQ